eukprot:CAMPEP_0119102030 /NCGR_PEP_ID=MMETSP1180-20130426/907_1 /TAXON_ID=3052 ORGANISM="Chlamydomonas cf sp, Strain CCMP681" /NCGR_SAMPLE_ID=MMETSP1180 /ASSEMBLY_ACC=CAM_ASM_000741 /LENGTH=416 /DNA_ID=CAMNT_0007086243 /DNA_START=1 /DNA_END=1251 /DNA_ORIENTATION=+
MGVALTIVVGLLGVILSVGWGPVSISLPGLPHVRIKDIPEEHRPLPSPPLEGVFKPNTALVSATVLFNGSVPGSETVHVLPNGNLLMLDKYGLAWLAKPNASAPGGYTLEPNAIAQLGPGRPLGFQLDSHGDVIVCMGTLGLVKLQLPVSCSDLDDPATPCVPRERAQVVLLAARVTADSPIDAGTFVTYANDLTIAKDGRIFFSDSQSVPVLPNYSNIRRPFYDSFTSYLQGMYAGQATGRLMVYHPNNGSLHVLAKGFWFPNGVALSSDESFVAFAETNQFRVLRYWLKGEKAGIADILITGLPGFPDGVSKAPGASGFWVALAAPHSGFFDIAMSTRLIRVVMAYLPAGVRPPMKKWGAVLKVSPDGEVLKFMLDPTGSHVSFISSVEEVADDGMSRLWMGSVSNNYVVYQDL